jgi:ribulose-5-phosphate 4-epimerase/fuculose-1-phosphate aldolase
MQLPSLKHVVSEDEWKLRVNLAACYRLVAMYGWSDLIFTHISAKLPESVSGKDHHFLINPYGLMFDEITASSLLKIDLQGKQINESSFYVNHAGFVIHSTIHEARHDAVCVLHTHSRAGVAVSAQKEGLLPISQQSSLLLSSLAYHDYEGLAVHDDERDRLKADLGDNKYMILRNHGLLTVGCSVPDAFLAMYFLETSCQIQISAQAGGP